MRKSLLIVGLLVAVFVAPARAQWDTMGDVKTSVLIRLNQTDSRRFPDSSLEDMINEAQYRCAVDLGAVRKLDTLTTVADQALYAANSDAIEGWPLEIIRYKGVGQEDRWTGLTFRRIGSWIGTGETQEAYFSGYVHAGKISIHPAPEEGDAQLIVFYRAFPPDLENDTATIVCHEADRPALLQYSCFLAASAVLWPDKAAVHKTEYMHHRQERQREFIGLGVPDAMLGASEQ